MSKKAKILVVEDNPQNMRLVIDLLEAEGFECLRAEDGKTAFELVEKEQPELILLDIRLPDIDGRDIFRKIRRDRLLDKGKIVAVTASVMAEEREEILKMGFNGYIAKPINIDTFVDEVRQFL